MIYVPKRPTKPAAVNRRAPAFEPSRALAATSFLLSAPTPQHLPPDRGAEVVIAGRSNAGKSSALNALTGQRALARVSKTPGCTRQLVVFRVDDERRLIDLPGYGFAIAPGAIQAGWQAGLGQYFRERRSLVGLLLAMDVRHPLTDFDRVMLALARSRALPVHVLLTKSDKLGRGAAAQVLRAVRRDLANQHAVTSVQLFSATAKLGLDPATRWIEERLGIAAPAADAGPHGPDAA